MRWSGAIVAVVLGIVSAPGTALAQSRGAPNRDFARYGVRTIVCDERSHDAPCLGLACREGALALASASGGGGPIDGATRISTGRGAMTLRFRYETHAVDRLGVAASEVDLALKQFEALPEAISLTLSAQADGRIRHTFPVRGLAREWRWAAQACR